MERRAYVLTAIVVVAAGGLGSCSRARFAMHALFGDSRAGEAPELSHLVELETGATCLDCHEGIDRPEYQPFAERGLVFSHARHVGPSSGNCMRCHQAIVSGDPELARRPPSMESCADGCHVEDFAELRCKQCHSDLSRYALESIATWSHGREFERRHGASARRDAAACATCHESTFCSDCHVEGAAAAVAERRVDSAVRAFIHPGGYEAVHAIDAEAGRDRCESCHRPVFCSSCHATRGLSGLADMRAPHPDGWHDPASPSFHGIAAKRSIASCAGCHDRGERSVCVRCHQVGGVGGNPHGRSFSRREAPAENRMCRVCHVP